MGSKKNVPEGWLDYSPIGKPIPGAAIICFKVPLKEEISRGVPEAKRFTPSMLIRKVPNLAGVIDVTNTSRYYSKQVFLDNGILHEKIFCPGHVVPPATVVQCFQKAMQRMWSVAESAGGKLVGVHCTHGINRTGYLVCRYLIECRGFHPEDAIRLFAESRGHGIERDNYVRDLRTLLPSTHNSTSVEADFHRKEEQRRMHWNTDVTNDADRTRRDHHRMRQADAMPPLRPLPPAPHLDRPSSASSWLPPRGAPPRDGARHGEEGGAWGRWDPTPPPQQRERQGGGWRPEAPSGGASWQGGLRSTRHEEEDHHRSGYSWRRPAEHPHPAARLDHPPPHRHGPPPPRAEDRAPSAVAPRRGPPPPRAEDRAPSAVAPRRGPPPRAEDRAPFAVAPRRGPPPPRAEDRAPSAVAPRRGPPPARAEDRAPAAPRRWSPPPRATYRRHLD